jgi:2-polyprenyl-3-methyl-5-hydroxy-6-metoxy-1,4-benzoquinol methylase
VAVDRTDIWPICWCGSGAPLAEFDAEYHRCLTCETLVCIAQPDTSTAGVQDDERDFYGSQYWFHHQAESYALPTIDARARNDLYERCVYWLRALLSVRPPPGRLLEVGASHGGFVKLASTAGFDSVGMEMSPAIVEFARTTFGIDMMRGPLENVDLPERSFDVICSFDVVEHLRDPLASLRRIRDLLVANGVVLIQTPQFPELSSAALRAKNDRFVEHLKSPEHIYLFSASAFSTLAARAGFAHTTALPPIFSYDQFVVLSSSPLTLRDDASIAADLLATPNGRVALALLDIDREVQTLRRVATERQAVIDELKAACDERLTLIQQLDAELRKAQGRL